MEGKHIYVYTVHNFIIYISLHNLEQWITVIFHAIKITVPNLFYVYCICLRCYLDFSSWSTFWLFSFMILCFIFHPIYLLCFYSNVQPENTALKSDSFSFGKLTDCHYIWPVAKSFLIFPLLKRQISSLNTIYFHVSTLSNSQFKNMFNPAAREMDHQTWKTIYKARETSF